MEPPRTPRFSRGAAGCVALVLALMPAAASRAQQTPAAAPAAAPARELPRPDELEPAVSTSPSAAAAAPAPAATATAPAAPTAPARASGSGGTRAAGRAAGADQTAPADAAQARTAGKKGADRLQLDATEITGNRELPKVLYIVPWKRSDLGDVTGKPVNSLLDEVLQPLDRDVFQRENRYYDALSPAANAPKPGAAQGSGNKP